MSWNDLRKGRFSQANGEYFITFTTDQRLPLFAQHDAAAGFCRSILINENCTDNKWLAWVLMPDHFHGLLQINGQYSLSEIVKDLKGRSAAIINKQLNVRGKRWQPAYFDRALRKDQDRRAVARYIVANPLRAQLVERIGDYPYWNTVFL